MTRRLGAPGEGTVRGRGFEDAGLSLLVFVVALLPRLYLALAWPREPVWDGHYYDFGARRIAAGFGYSDGVTTWHPWCHWPVGYSAFLAAIFRLVGSGPHVATVANAVVGALTAVLVHRLARYALGRGAALAGGLLCALAPGLVAFAPLVMSEPLSGLFLVLAAWLACRNRERRPWLGAVLGGGALGAGALVHPTFLAFAPGLGVVVGLSASGSRRRTLLRVAGSGAVALACALLAVLPWTVRNCRVMDRCALVSTNGGWNLAIGSFPRATGRFETLRSTDGCAVVTGQVQQDDCWRALGLHYIAQEPGRWLGLLPKKLSFTFDHESFQVEYLHEADPDRWPEPRRVAGRWLLTLAHRVLLTLAAFGLVVCQSRTRRGLVVRLAMLAVTAALAFHAWQAEAHPFYGLALLISGFGLFPEATGPGRAPVVWWAAFCVFATVVTHAVFFGEDRYHVVVTPMLALLAAAPFRKVAPSPDTGWKSPRRPPGSVVDW